MAQSGGKAAQPNALNRFTRYLKDVRAEMRRVVWPTRPEVVNSSVVVLVSLVLFTSFVAVVDFLARSVILNFLANIGR